MPSKEKSEKEKLIEALREQVKKAESKNLFDTAHHQMLEQLLKGEKKGEITNG
jgi:hypothetical protein